jgi:hypothetical protein
MAGAPISCVTSMKYRVGIIGCGRMASTIDDEHQGPRRSGLVPPHAHAGGYARVEETEMVAACDVDTAKLSEVRSGLSWLRFSDTMGVMDTRSRTSVRPIKSIRLGSKDQEHLRTLADRWQCCEAAAVRRAIAIVAEQELAGHPTSQVDPDWQERFERLLSKAQSSDTGDLTPEELEREVTLAVEEVRQETRAGLG